MKRIYVSPENVSETIARINRLMSAKNEFWNIRTTAYHGKKYPANTIVIIIG